MTLEGRKFLICLTNLLQWERIFQTLQNKPAPQVKSFCGGPGGGFFKRSPLAAGGMKIKIPCVFFIKKLVKLIRLHLQEELKCG